MYIIKQVSKKIWRGAV